MQSEYYMYYISVSLTHQHILCILIRNVYVHLVFGCVLHSLVQRANLPLQRIKKGQTTPEVGGSVGSLRIRCD